MKRYLFLIAMLATIVSTAQIPVLRSTNSNIALDSRLRVLYNFEVPRYRDTTEANTNRGLDSSGAMIKTNYPDALWVRGLFPKKWFNLNQASTIPGTVSYNDLTNKPTIPAAQVNSDWNSISGSSQILNKPTIPAAQVSSDWNSVSGVSQVLNKPLIPNNTNQLTNGAGFGTASALVDTAAAIRTSQALKAPLADPNFSGIPRLGADTLATKAYARGVAGSGGGGAQILYSGTGSNTDGSLTQAASTNLFATKRNLVDTGYVKGLTAEATVGTLGKTRDSIGAIVGTKRALNDTGYVKGLVADATVGTLAKVRDSLSGITSTEISNRISADNLKANLADPVFTGTPKISTDTIATKAYARSIGVGTTNTFSAPLAQTGTNVTADTTYGTPTALTNQGRVKMKVDSLGAVKASLNSPTFTGAPVLPTGTIVTTQSAGNSSSAIASTAFVTTANNLKANLASPALTGTPTTPTAAVGTNTTQIASTAHVFAERSSTATLTNKTLDFVTGGNVATNLSPTTSFKQDSITVLSDGSTIRTVNNKSVFGSGDISHMLASDGASHTSSGTSSEVTLYSVFIPANTLGNNGYLRLEWMVSMTNNGTSKLFQVKVSNTLIAYADLYTSDGYRCVTTYACQNSQILGKSPHPVYNFQATGAISPYYYSSALGRQINWGVDNTLTITALTDAANSMTLEDVHLFTYH